MYLEYFYVSYQPYRPFFSIEVSYYCIILPQNPVKNFNVLLRKKGNPVMGMIGDARAGVGVSGVGKFIGSKVLRL